jgi:hypothetical protein
MPFSGTELRYTLACGPDETGRWRGWFTVQAEATALRRLGLHPDQPASRIVAPAPWWYDGR